MRSFKAAPDDKTSTANLWPGDELIINAKNLYDGKVVN